MRLTAAGTLMRRSLTAALMLALMTAPALTQAQSFTPQNEGPTEFPPGPGREQTFYTCTACHGFKLVAQQGQSRRQWDETLEFMSQRHSMPRLEGNDRKVVLDYLEASFPPRTSPPGFQNPFLNR